MILDSKDASYLRSTLSPSSHRQTARENLIAPNLELIKESLRESKRIAVPALKLKPRRKEIKTNSHEISLRKSKDTGKDIGRKVGKVQNLNLALDSKVYSGSKWTIRRRDSDIDAHLIAIS